MLYIKTSNPGKAIHLIPITNDNIYTHSESCGRMVQIYGTFSKGQNLLRMIV